MHYLDLKQLPEMINCRLLDELYQEPVDITTLNDLLWFDDDFIYEQLGIELEQEITCSRGCSFLWGVDKKWSL